MLPALVALLVLAAPRPIQGQTISDIEPDSGTLAGGTRLTIYGDGFADMYTGSQVVFVGSYPCQIIGHLTSSKVVTCETSAADAGTYPVVIMVNGQDPVSYWGYTYTYDRTPTLRALSPRAGPPGSPVLLYGQATWNLRYRDCVAEDWGDISCVGAVMFGDYLCRQDPKNEDTVVTFGDYKRYGYGMFRVGCTLPQPSMNNTQIVEQPSLGTAGNLQVTMHFEASMRGGEPLVSPMSYLYDESGTPYHFQLFPEVTSVSPAQGSTQGGTLLTITGRGFPDLAAALGDKVVVDVAGVPCTVVTSTYGKLTCVTGPAPANPPLSAVPHLGQYPGMRGVEYEFYNTRNTSMSYNKLWMLNTTLRVDAPFANASGMANYKRVLYDTMEVPDFTVSYYCSRMKAFFRAPRDGNYTFFAQADDFAQLNATWVQNGATRTRMLLNLTTWTQTDSWNVYGFQRAAPIALAAAQPVLLELNHCNGQDIGHAQLAVQMPSTANKGNAIAEVQRLEVRSQIRPRAVYVKYMYGAGAWVNAWQIEIVADDDAKLDNPALGLSLTLNGNVVVTVPVTAVSDDLDNAIEKALGAPFNVSTPANDAYFGVSKTRSQGKVTLVLGMDANVRDTFEVTTATLVTLDTTLVTFTPSNCTYVNPLVAPGPSPPPPGPPDATLGVAVLVSQAMPVPAVEPSGSFLLGVPGSSVAPEAIPFNATTAYVQAAVRNLTGQSTTVRVNTTLQGTYVATVWTVLFDASVFDNVPNLFASGSEDTPSSGVMLVTEVRPANPPLAGSFWVSYGTECESVRISLTDGPETIRTALGTLPGMATPRRVEVTGSGASGYNILVTFDPDRNPNDQPPLLVADTRDLLGVKPTVTVVTVQDGTPDAWYAPIPAEFLQLAVASPTSIRVVVNGAPAACAHPSGICGFAYSADATPTVTSVTPSTLAFSTEASLPITITGTGFTMGTGLEVKVGDAPCTVTSSSATQIVCSVSDVAAAGVRQVSVRVLGFGFATGAPKITLKTLYVADVQPVRAAGLASGTVLRFVGKGFDAEKCADNVLAIGGVTTRVLACTTTSLTVLYPGAASASPTATVLAQVFEDGAEIDSDSPGNFTIAASDAAPAITAISSPAAMPGAGGRVAVTLSGSATPADVRAMSLVPKVAASTNFTTDAAAYAGRIPCPSVAPAGSGAPSDVACVSGAVPIGDYQVLVELTSGLQLLSASAINFDLVIASVSPSAGSIGGGTTVTITGSGFSTVAAENIVFLTVPVSTTFLNGIIQCDVVSATVNQLQCVTRAHLATNADADDAMARNVMPVATQQRGVQVVICDPSLNTTVLREYCWSRAATPRSRCATNDGACDFGYSTELTPAIQGVSPATGYLGTTVTVSGAALQDVATVQVLQGRTVRATCTNVVAQAGQVTCTAPDLPAGAYTLVLRKANGESSVDALKRGTFTYVTVLAGVTDNYGSVAGGLPLTVTAAGAGFAVGPDNMTANSVTIGGLDCPLIEVTNATQLKCLPQGLMGTVLAEYWNLGVNIYSMPDLINFQRPTLTKLEKGLNLNWNTTSPMAGVINPDFWGGRFTFYWQTMQQENVTFYINSDDDARLYIDDSLIGGRLTKLPVSLAPGYHKIVVTYVEWTGLARVQLMVAPNVTAALTLVPWAKVTPVPPGTPAPITATVNGIPAVAQCPEATVQLPLPGQPELLYEPPTVTTPAGTCAYLYSLYRTPLLVPAPGVPMSSGVNPPQFSMPTINMQVYGQFMTDPNISDLDQISITLGGQQCVIESAANVTWLNATLGQKRIGCDVPALPVGVWDVTVMVKGLGYARPPVTYAVDLPKVTFQLKFLQFNSPLSTISNQPCQLSLFGGGTLNVSTFGMVKGIVDPVYKRRLAMQWDPSIYLCKEFCDGKPGNLPSPAYTALMAGNFEQQVLACDGPTVAIRYPRVFWPTAQGYAGNTTFKTSLRWRPIVIYTDTGVVEEQLVWNQQTIFCGARTPWVVVPTPTSAPNAGGRLSLSWGFNGLGTTNDTLRVIPVGAPSNASIELQSGPNSPIIPCTNSIVSFSNTTTNTYNESVSCALPSYLPASNYTIWVCLQPFGCGIYSYYKVPLTVTAISATSGGSGGGTIVTVIGLGFDTDPSKVAVRFGDSNCTVSAASTTSVTCETGPLPARPASVTTLPLSIIATTDAPEVTFPSFTFSFDPTLEANLSSVFPARGSTEGGTPITLTGSFDTAAATTVTIGNVSCTNVTVVSATTITCVTGKPPQDIVRKPMPVVVYQTGRGYARSYASYQYIDLWSRNSTWGGKALPDEGATVVIPYGITVLLDVSPPVLYVLVLEGNLIFDDTQPDVHLQANYIIVKGGNLTIGTPDKPYTNKATITLHGKPTALDLPMYGAKALGVREGVVQMYGQPKVPTYTTLNVTADPGTNRIFVNGQVNWQAGDRIVIASSSFYAEEVDEATIVSVNATADPTVTMLVLDAPLSYTHLGVIHRQAGVATGLDMRAEVAVLTRNILLTGDADSAKYMYGMQIMVNSPSYMPRALIQLDNVEVTQSGQAFRLGRYSIHWHMHGDVAYQSWVRGCSIHHTYNRAVTIHGTHRAIIQNTLAYNTMGHTFFLEDGIESGNLIEGNIGILTRVSDALLNTDTTPATFWITNPNNTVRNNVAAGSMAYGYWYRMLDNPEGPSYTDKVCPKFTQMLEFTNNRAHSNLFYGLRVHPEYYPVQTACNGFGGGFVQSPAVFNGLVSYKNGMKAAICTQCGLVQFANMVMGDNGAGPVQHIVNGKDNGASFELSWVVDNRNRYDLKLDQMAGLHNATIYARTTSGNRGNAGQWPSNRRVTGVIAQSPVQGDPNHSALMSLINVTFVDFTGGQFYALESCGKCKTFQGGATTFTSGLQFVQSDGSRPALSFWSWGHQGVFLDTDGTLINPNTTNPALLAQASAANWTVGNGTTWHSAVDSELFDPRECVYVRGDRGSNNGAFCAPSLTFRRVMLNNHDPEALTFKDLKLVSLATNRTSRVNFTHYNEEGYQFTVATGRDYWVHWDMPFRLDPKDYTLHKMDLMTPAHHVFISSKHVQKLDHFEVNGRVSSLTAMPQPANASHGAFYYNKTFTPNTWWWGNRTYNDTKFSVFVSGPRDNWLQVSAMDCPVDGCNSIPEVVVDIRSDVLYWSNASTWDPLPMPAAGDNVTVPFGWRLVVDVSPPPLANLVIQGDVMFDPTQDITLTATYIAVIGSGTLRAGSPSLPHPRRITIALNGSRDTPDWAIDNSLNLGSKVLAAIRGGTIDLYGRPVTKRWTRLAAPAAIGDTNITLADGSHGWRVGDRIVITATTFNVWQSEMRSITAIRDNGTTLVLDTPLQQPHGAKVKSYPGGPTVDMRAEVGLLSSTITITAVDGEATHNYGTGELFGGRVVVHGNSTGRFSGIAMQYCGQAGLLGRACVLFDRLAAVTVNVTVNGTASGNSTAANTTMRTIANPSFLRNSALVYGMNSNVRVAGVAGVSNAVDVSDNVMYESYDIAGVDVLTSGNTIRGNLVLGTIKDMVGKSGFDIAMPASFQIMTPDNWVENNVAAGSERLGFMYYGTPCGAYASGSFRNNAAHSNLAGVWMRSSSASYAAGCTALSNFTTYMNWDFGIITTRGIETDVVMTDVNVLDTKHSGVTLMRLAFFTERGSLEWRGGLLAGQSGDDVCAACTTLSDPGCHKKLSRQSYNQATPFTPAVGLQSAMFALQFTVGPEKKPWDKPMGYSVVHGKFNISGVTLADFLGPAGCGGSGAGTYALANHPESPEAFHPHYFSSMNVVNVPTGPAQGLFYHVGPDPAWRNEADCGTASLKRADGSTMLLNCAGPAHVYWRDLDGSLIAGGDPAGRGTVAGAFLSGPRTFPEDQGSPVLPGPCTYSSVLKSYRCAQNSSAFLLDERMKPNPVPAAGIWGDPQFFVLESRDKDSEDRNFGPVMFNVSGSVDYVSAAMDHGWCFAYTCQKRLSTFWTYLPTGQTTYVSFTGTPSNVFRLWLPYAAPESEVVLVINYLGSPNRRFVWLPPGMGAFEGRLTPETKPPTVGDGTAHGAFFWDQSRSLLYVKITGGKTMEIRTESAVTVAQSLALTIDAFYATQAIFLENLCAVMNISRDRVYIASIVPGSINVQIGIGQSFESSNQPLADTSPVGGNGMDSATQAEIRQQAAAQGIDPEVLLTQYKNDAAVLLQQSADPNVPTPTAPAQSPVTDPSTDIVKSLSEGTVALFKLLTDPAASSILGVELLGTPQVVGLDALPDSSIAAALSQELARASIPVSSNPTTSGGGSSSGGSTGGGSTGGGSTGGGSTGGSTDGGSGTGGSTGGGSTGGGSTGGSTDGGSGTGGDSGTVTDPDAGKGSGGDASNNNGGGAPAGSDNPGGGSVIGSGQAGDGGASTPGGSSGGDKKDTSTATIIASVVAAVGGTALVAMVAIAAVLVARRRAEKRRLSLDGSDAVAPASAQARRSFLDEPVTPGGGPRSSQPSRSGNSVREAFVSPNPAYEPLHERQQQGRTRLSVHHGGPTDSDAEFEVPAGAVVSAGAFSPHSRTGSRPGSRPDSRTGTPRFDTSGTSPHPRGSFTGSLAAGYSIPSPAEKIGPLVSTNPHPRTSPLNTHLQPLAPIITSGPSGPAANSPLASRPKSPAELLRNESLGRQSAPNPSFRNLAQPFGVVPDHEGGEHSGPGCSGGSVSAGPASPLSPPSGMVRPISKSVTERSGSGLTFPQHHGMQRTAVDVGPARPHRLPPVERVSPQPGAFAAAGEGPSGDAVTRVLDGQAADEVDPARPESAAKKRPSQLVGPMMAVPGGLGAFAASPSLLRSEAANTMVDAGARPFGVVEENDDGERDSGTPVARSPAGLHSDSMRKRQ